MSDAGGIEKPEVDDIDADLQSAIKELQASGTIEETTEANIVIDKPERPRDPAGKFVAKEETTEKPKRETLTLPEKVAQPVVDAQPQVAAPAIKPPEGWRSELKAKFGELPPDIQAEISRRESEVHKAMTRQDEERGFGRKISEIVTPYLPTIRAEGGTPEQAITQLLQTAHSLRQGDEMHRARGIALAMQQFNVRPEALQAILQGASVQSGSPLQQAPISPTQISEMVQAELAKQRQLQEEQSLQAQIEEFSTKPGHEHFEKVRPVMAALLESKVAKDLEDAYERAVYADPEIRSSLIAAAKQADQDKRITEQSARTERAKSAAVSITGAPGAAKPNGHAGSLGSIEDDLKAAWREVNGRV